MHVLVALMTAAFFPISALVANFMGFCSAVTLSYFAHASFTFGIDPEHRLHFPRFVVAALGGLGSSSFITWVIHDRLQEPLALAMMLVAVTVPPVTFILLRSWVFATRGGMDRRGLIGLGLSALMALSFLGFFWGWPQNHDVAWYLVATRRWLDGARLYVDLLEVNPPLNFYLTVPTILFSDLTGISDSNSEYVILAALLFASMYWSWMIVCRHNFLSQRRQVVFHFVLWAALLLPDLQSMGQRDQLLVFFTLPWLLGLISDGVAERPGPRIARAGFAAIGICLKPHFLLLPLVVTLWRMARMRSLWYAVSLENLTIGLVGGVYVLLVWLLHPSYFEDIVPIGMLVYRDYSFGFSRILYGLSPELFPALLLPLVSAVFARRSIPAAGLFILLPLCGVGTYLAQWMGFSYHRIPFLAFSCISFGWFLLQPARPFHLVVTTTLALSSLLAAELAGGLHRNGVTDELAHLLNGRQSIEVLSTDLVVGPIVALEIGAHWASRYPALWLVPGVVNELARADCGASPERCKALRMLAARVRRDVTEDIATFHPDAIVIDKAPPFVKVQSFSWQAFMAGSSLFPTLKRDYQLMARTARFDIWISSHPRP